MLITDAGYGTLLFMKKIILSRMQIKQGHAAGTALIVDNAWAGVHSQWQLFGKGSRSIKLPHLTLFPLTHYAPLPILLSHQDSAQGLPS